MPESIPLLPCAGLDKYERYCGKGSDPHAPAALCEAHLHEVYAYVMRQGRELMRASQPLSLPDLRPSPESVIYYARIGSSVKIGWSTRLDDRMKAINPEELMATEPGGRALERQRHDEFKDLRTHGEWFRLGPRLVDHIATL